MIFYCTNRFITQVGVLEKNKSNASVIKDICEYFKDKDVSELHITKDIIQNSSNVYSLNKLRISNCLSNKGKSSSYRCICGVFVKNNYIVLDTIYPKTGSDGIDNITKEAYKDIAINIRDSISKNNVFILDIEKQIFKENI